MNYASLVILFLSIMNPASSSGNMSLSCITTKNVRYDRFPMFKLDANEKKVYYDANDLLTIGPPVCVIFFGYNRTHSATWQGHVTSFALPLECHTESVSHTFCFPSPNQFNFLTLSKGFVCCCSYDNCNLGNPTFFEIFEKVTLGRYPLLDRIKPLCKYFFCISFIVFFVIIEAVLETALSKMCKRETTKTEPELPKEIRSTMAPLNREGPPKKASVSLMVENTQPSTRNTSKLTEISVQSPEKQVLDQEQGIDKSGNLSSSELEVMNTQDDTSEKLPIPKKPESRKLSNGRMQKTSMNYEESTYSDLT